MVLKQVAFLFPLFAALSWGFLYPINSRNYSFINIPSSLLIGAVGMGVMAGVLSVLLKMPIDIRPYFYHPEKGWLWLAFFIMLSGTVFLQLSLSYCSATYTGLVEIIYVAIIPLAAYFLFGQKQWSPSILIGGAIMAVGLMVVMVGQASGGKGN